MNELDIREWLIALSLRCSVRTTENLEIMAKDFALGLIDLSDDAFTPQSREAAARKWDSFPSYRALRKFLVDWCEEQASPYPLLPPIADESLSAQDQVFVKTWQNSRAKDFAHLKDRDASLRGRMAISLDVLRLRAFKAFAYVCRTDAEAESVARQHGWIVREEPIDVSERAITRTLIEIDQLAAEGGSFMAACASAKLTMLHAAVKVQAPERLHLLPETITARPERPRSVSAQLAALQGGAGIDAAREAVASASVAFEAQHGRKPGALTPEQLTALRSAAGVPDLPAPKPPEPFAFTEAAEPEVTEPEPPSAGAKPISGLPWWMIEGSAA